MDYSKQLNYKITPQNRPIPGKKMIENNAEGYVFQKDIWEHLERFLLIGTEGGTYYVSEQKLTSQNIDNSIACIMENPHKVLDMIYDISVNGKAPKNDPAIFLLVLLFKFAGTSAAKRKAGELLPEICRTGTHLFTFVHFVDSMRSWGRTVRRAVSNWYSMNIDKLEYQIVKYKGRTVEGSENQWTHRDVLRSCHARPLTGKHDLLFGYITKGNISSPLIAAYEKLQSSEDVNESISLIKEYRIPHDSWPTWLKNNKKVWEAGLTDLPLTALIRNLNKLTQLEVLREGDWDRLELIQNKLTSQEYIKKSRVHPMTMLTAMRTYGRGEGIKGDMRWNPIKGIEDALEKGFYLSFENVEAIDKKIFVAVDVSGSMGQLGNGILSCSEIAACMAMIVVRKAEYCIIKGFSDELKDVKISSESTLTEVIRKTRMPFGSTDCALPMIWALENKIDIDAFVIYTDNETWFGNIHPSQALNQYRQRTKNIDSKLIVNAITSTKFSIADPKDPNSLDVVGFNTSTPQAISAFINK